MVEKGRLLTCYAGKTVSWVRIPPSPPVGLKSEPILEKIRTLNFSPSPFADARHPAKKFFSHFLICARPIFSSPPAPRLQRAGKRKRKLFCGVLLLTSRAAWRSVSFVQKRFVHFQIKGTKWRNCMSAFFY